MRPARSSCTGDVLSLRSSNSSCCIDQLCSFAHSNSTSLSLEINCLRSSSRAPVHFRSECFNAKINGGEDEEKLEQKEKTELQRKEFRPAYHHESGRARRLLQNHDEEEKEKRF